MHVSLTQTLDSYVREQVASGLYNNASEVVREALRCKIAVEEEDSARLRWLRRAIDEGWNQADAGQFASFDMDAINTALDSETDA